MTFDKLYHTDDSLFIGAPTNLKLAAELAIFRELQKEDSDDEQEKQ